MQHIKQWKEKKREEWSKYASQLLIAHPEMTFLEVQPLIADYWLSQIPSLLTLLEEEIKESIGNQIEIDGTDEYEFQERFIDRRARNEERSRIHEIIKDYFKTITHE